MEIKKEGDQVIFEHENENDASSAIIRATFLGKDVPFSVVTGSEANQIARWQLITKELEFSIAQLEVVINRIKTSERSIHFDRRVEEGVIIKSLIDSAIVGYMKCFNQAHGRKVKLEAHKFFTGNLGKKFFDHHMLVKYLRNSYIAHAGITQSEGSSMVAIIDPKPPKGISPKCVAAHSFFSIPGIEFLEKTLEMVNFVFEVHTRKLQEKMNVFCHKVVESPEKYGVDDIFGK